jgi:HPt (histidine-containing phosphotransfer) domain-containing protein
VREAGSSLAERFLERTRGDLMRLATLWERGRGGDRDAFNEVEFLAHAIHGAGAIFGFPAISTAAGKLEQGAQHIAQGAALEWQPLENSLAELVAALDAGEHSGVGGR